MNAHRDNVYQFERGHRTREQIIAQMEARYTELEREAARRAVDPAINAPCKTCRHYSTYGKDGFHWGRHYPEYHTCTHPLVKGFNRWGVETDKASLCGPEKALWEAEPTLWQRLVDWFLAPWRAA